MKTYAVFDDSFFQIKPWWMPEKLYRVVCQRSNPRSKDYMMELLHDKFPDAKLIDLKKKHYGCKIILLYPDSIGIGFRKIESILKMYNNEIIVLNGRKRVFALKPSVHKQLLLYRFLEITFLPEILITPFFVLYGVCIAAKDKFIGYKS